MNKIVIFGASEFEQRLKYYIETYTTDKVAAFCVDRPYKKADEFCGIPIVALDEIERSYPPQSFYALVGIGYKDMNSLRKRKHLELKGKKYTFYNFIHPTAFVDPTVELGEGNIILGHVIIDYAAHIGHGNIFETGTAIAHECKINDFNFFSVGVAVGGKVEVANTCFFGLNATIRSAIHIQNSTLIGAGCYIDHDTEEQGVYVPVRSAKLAVKSSDMKIIYRRN